MLVNFAGSARLFRKARVSEKALDATKSVSKRGSGTNLCTNRSSRNNRTVIVRVMLGEGDENAAATAAATTVTITITITITLTITTATTTTTTAATTTTTTTFTITPPTTTTTTTPHPTTTTSTTSCMTCYTQPPLKLRHHSIHKVT